MVFLVMTDMLSLLHRMGNDLRTVDPLATPYSSSLSIRRVWQKLWYRKAAFDADAGVWSHASCVNGIKVHELVCHL